VVEAPQMLPSKYLYSIAAIQPPISISFFVEPDTGGAKLAFGLVPVQGVLDFDLIDLCWRTKVIREVGMYILQTAEY